MTYKLSVEITHKSFNEPLKKEFYYHGVNKLDVLAQIETLPQHLHNLDKHGRAAFKDVNGVKHKWTLKLIPDLN